MSPWRALYPLIVLTGLMVSYWALCQRYAKSQLDSQQRTAIGLAAFVGAMLGAKFPFWLTAEISQNSWLWFADGKTILGGIFGGYLAVELTKGALGIAHRTGDHFAIPIAIAVGFGRLGCFTSGCCYGAVTSLPWGVHFPSAQDAETVFRHPAQLYEVAFHFLAIVALLICESKDWFRERRLTLYLASYLVFRFLTEWVRPEPIWYFGLTGYQIACIVLLILLGLAEWWASWRSRFLESSDGSKASSSSA